VRVLALLLVAALLAPAGALAATCPKTSLSDIEDEVMCLQCGVPLNLSEDAPSAKRERAFIQSRVDRCESKQQIKDELVAQFGDGVLAEPKSSTAWLIPAIAFAAGALGVALGARRWRRRRVTPAAPGAAGPALDADDSARLDADIERYDL
jgi:cytochrome c-type biogenesis protein CcmH